MRHPQTRPRGVVGPSVVPSQAASRRIGSAWAFLLLVSSIWAQASSAGEDPNEPNDDWKLATVIAYDYESSGTSIDPEGDVDLYRFEGTAGDAVDIRTHNVIGSSLDGRLWLMNSEGRVLLNNDNDVDASSSRMTVLLPQSGTYVIRYAYRLNLPTSAGIRAEKDEQRTESRVAPESRAVTTSPVDAGGDPSGAYVLTLERISPPSVTDFAAGSGFDGFVPLAWNSPQISILEDGSLEHRIERSADGGDNFDEVGGAPTYLHYIDEPAPNGQELVYRVRTIYPHGAEDAFSEQVRVMPIEDGYAVNSPYTHSPPVIDGAFQVDEWSQAVRIPLIEEATHQEVGTLWIQNDDQFLYLATERAGPTDEVGIYFDADNDDSYSALGTEGNFWITGVSGISFRPIIGNYPGPDFGARVEDPAGVTASGSISGALSRHEIRIDLKASTLQAELGDEIGMYLYDLVGEDFAVHPVGPGEVLYIAPQTFANVTLQVPRPEVHLSTTSMVFENAPIGLRRVRELSIENRGTGTLVIDRLELQGADASQFDIDTTTPIELDPGNGTQISVAFEPTVHGVFQATLAIESNDAGGPSQVTLNGKSPNQPPQIEVPDPAARAVAGENLEVLASATDDLAVASVICEYVSGGGAINQVSLVRGTGSVYRGTIPGGAIGPEGIHYRVRVRDGEEASTEVGPFEPIVFVPGTESPRVSGGSAQSAYRLVSIPLSLEDDGVGVFAESFGAPDPKKWRLYSLSESGTYVDVSDQAGIQPGEALWFLSKDGGAIRTGAGEVVPHLEPFAIPLRAGWNLIGNPFAFGVSVDRIGLASGGFADIRRYDGSWSRETVRLAAFGGYAVFSETATDLQIDPAPGRPARSTRTDGSSPGPPFDGEFDLDWEVRIEARCQGARDADNFIGGHSAARMSRDRFDLPEPPPVGEYVSLFFSHPEWGGTAERFCSDVRPLELPGSWTLELRSNIEDRIEISFDLDRFPTDRVLRVLDPVTGVVWDPRLDPRFEIGPATGSGRRLQLWVGEEEETDEAIEAARTGLAGSAVVEPFPNPFRGATTILYHLSEELRTTVEIFGVDGVRVRTLVDRELQSEGRHAVVWDGRDQRGDLLPSGAYFYSVHGGRRLGGGRILLVR